MSKNSLTTASVLAFERKLSNSDALMHAGKWQQDKEKIDWKPITIETKSVRGTISNRLKNALQKKPAKLDAEIENANLQTVDMAALPFDADTLKVSFTLRVLGDVMMPSVCNDQEYQTALTDKINAYIKNHKLSTLAVRYAENIANGRFLWRNRIGAEEITVNVSHIVDNKPKKTWTFSCDNFSLREFTQPTGDLKELAEIIEQGLTGTKNFVLLKVEAFVRLGDGQEVFPSQELVLDKRNDNKKSKTLYAVNGIAAMHSQKIGNALRTIDTWHPEADTFGPIAVEPYGSVTTRGKACRQPTEKMDFYHLLDDWILKDKEPAIEQQHYVVATLIRGGVFGASSKE